MQRRPRRQHTTPAISPKSSPTIVVKTVGRRFPFCRRGGCAGVAAAPVRGSPEGGAANHAFDAVTRPALACAWTSAAAYRPKSKASVGRDHEVVCGEVLAREGSDESRARVARVRAWQAFGERDRDPACREHATAGAERDASGSRSRRAPSACERVVADEVAERVGDQPPSIALDSADHVRP